MRGVAARCRSTMTRLMRMVVAAIVNTDLTNTMLMSRKVFEGYGSRWFWLQFYSKAKRTMLSLFLLVDARKNCTIAARMRGQQTSALMLDRKVLQKDTAYTMLLENMVMPTTLLMLIMLMMINRTIFVTSCHCALITRAH